MPKHKETKIVDFTDIQMFDLVADIDSYDLFLSLNKCSYGDFPTFMTKKPQIEFYKTNILFDDLIYISRNSASFH